MSDNKNSSEVRLQRKKAVKYKRKNSMSVFAGGPVVRPPLPPKSDVVKEAAEMVRKKQMSAEGTGAGAEGKVRKNSGFKGSLIEKRKQFFQQLSSEVR